MKDRVVQYPHRYKLTPVSGQPDTFDLVAVPGEVVEPGTPLNKGTLLSDEVAKCAKAETINVALANMLRLDRESRITANSIWVSPVSGLLLVTLSGAGGGGGRGAHGVFDRGHQGGRGGAGGGGGAIITFLYFASEGERIEIKIGIGGNQRVDGGSSSFHGLTAYGGKHGVDGDEGLSQGPAGGAGGGGYCANGGNGGSLQSKWTGLIGGSLRLRESPYIFCFNPISIGVAEAGGGRAGGAEAGMEYSGAGGGGGGAGIGNGGNGGKGAMSAQTASGIGGDGGIGAGGGGGGGGHGVNGIAASGADGGGGGGGICIIRHCPVNVHI